MLISKCCGARLSVKSMSVFPDLLPFESKVVPRQTRVRLACAQSGALCTGIFASLPVFLLFAAVLMIRLASS